MSSYELGMLVVAVALLGAVVLPRLLADKPLSFPMFYVGFGALLFWIAPVPAVDPVAESTLTEHLTELVVIIALMGVGLKIDRPFGLKSWTATWRLIGITMPLSIASVAVLGWLLLGLHPATAILLGAVLAPTDPVLASDVEAGAPLTEMEVEAADVHEWGSIRFALTSEAGLNDGLAFPFTYLAIAVAGASAGDGLGWLVDWGLVDVGYRIVVGLLFGVVIGHLMARLVFHAPAVSEQAELMAGGEALVTTLFAYGLTELAGGYGFLAVFVAALELRRFEWEHGYYHQLHDFAAVVERLLMATVLVLFGGAIASGLLAPLTWEAALLGLGFLLVVRPLAGVVGFLGSSAPWVDRLVISSFGIRGIGSFYYLSYALADASFQELELLVAAELLWAFVGFVVLASVVVHGVAASPVMTVVDRHRPSQDETTPDT
ncbi:MAG: cation:proton antiporter [Euryarchaeota archaeon]|nr:cation:proton antiporter [Euryarchaeota archaeon]